MILYYIIPEFPQNPTEHQKTSLKPYRTSKNSSKTTPEYPRTPQKPMQNIPKLLQNVLYYNLLHYVIFYFICIILNILHYIILYGIIINYIKLYYIILYYIIIYCFILYYIIFFLDLHRLFRIYCNIIY